MIFLTLSGEPGEKFTQFLNLLGDKISMKGWTHYRGDIGQDSDQYSYYTEWNGIEIMFHIAGMRFSVCCC
jgi:hypothetical protein